MPPEDLAPREAAQWARRAGLPLAPDRVDLVTATANHIQAVVATLRELDFGDVPPASEFPVTFEAESVPGTRSTGETPPASDARPIPGAHHAAL